MHLFRKSLFLLTLLALFSFTSAALASGQTTDFASQLQPIQQEISSSAAVRVIPNEGNAGDSHTVLVTGLNEDESVTVRVIYDESGDTVYSRDFIADVRGRVEVSLFTEQSDPPGDYTIEVLNEDGTVIGSANLTILEPIGLDAVLEVTPATQAAGERFTIEIEDLQPFADLEVQVRNENQEIVFSTRLRASVDGTATVNFRSHPEDDAGEYSVRVLFDGDIEVASGTFTVTEQVFDVATVIAPAEVLPGGEIFVTVSGLEPESAATLEILRDGNPLETRDIQANVNGLAIVALTIGDDTALGNYTVNVLQGEELISRGRYTVFVPDLTVTITPETNVPGQPFAIEISGLLPAETVDVELIEAGEAIETITVTGDENGEAQIALATDSELDSGTYGVRVVRRGSVAYSQVVRVEPGAAPETAEEFDPADVTLTIEPESGPAPTTYTYTVTGLPANADVTVNIVFEGTVVLSIPTTSDENGVVVTGATSEATDPPGEYVLEVLYEDEVISEDTFFITEDVTEEDTTPEETVTGDATLTVDPAVVATGDRFSVIASDLPAGETVTVEVIFDGEAVFTTERTVDANGNVTLGLRSDETDETGTYTVRILSGDALLAETSFEITDAASAQAAQTEISITPDSGEIGTDYTITVTGLEAGETILFDVTYNGTSIFTTEREADANGTVTLVLTTEEGDATGEYTVNVTRASGATIAGTFLAGDAEATPPDTAQTAAEISVTPESGSIGTDHTVTVTGLNPNEAITLDVIYDGESVFTTERQADANGDFGITLTTEDGDPPGEYTITIIREDGSVLSDALFAEAVDTMPETAIGEFDITIEPAVVGREEPFDVQITGLEAGETVTIEVLYEGAIVFDTERAADTDGAITLNLQTDTDDEAGEYEIRVRRADESIATETFVLQPAEEPAVQPESAVEVTVTPPSGPIGTTHEFVVTGLEAGETVELAVRYEGETLFSSTRQADESGSLNIILSAEEGDDLGLYTFEVLRGDRVVASSTFTVEGDSAEITPPVEQPEEQPQEGVLTFDEETFTGRLTTDEPAISYTFSGEAGQSVIIALSSVQFDPYLTLLDNTGVELASNDDADGLNSRIGPYQLPYTGEYTVVVSSFGAQSGNVPGVGRFDLTLESLELETFEIDLGSGSQTDVNSLTRTAPQITYTFSGTEGDVVLISLVSGQFDPYLILRDAQGRELARNDDRGDTLDAEIGPYELPYTGEYTIIATSYSYETFGELVAGDYELLYETVNLAQGAYDTAITLPIAADSGTHLIEFEGTSGDVISITVNSDQTVDTVATLIAPDGLELTRDDDGGSGFDPEINGFVLPQDGRYTVLVRPFTAGATGSVDLLITLDDVRTLDAEARTVRLNSKQTSDVLIFDGVAGETISMTITLQSGFVGSLSINAQQGIDLLMSYQTYGLPQTITLGFVVPEDGTVRIDIADTGGGNAVYEFEIDRE